MAVGLTQNFVKGMVNDNYGYMWDSESFDEVKEPYKMFMTNPEDDKGPDEDYYQSTSVVGMGSMRETSESEGFQPRTATEGFTVYATRFTFTDMAEYSKKAVKNHQKIKDLTKATSQEWGSSMKTTRNKFFSTAFNEGGKTAGHRYFNGTPESQAVTDSSGDVCYDSIPFFNLSTATRTSKGGATYYNGFAYDLDPDNLETILNLGKGTNNRMENDEITTLNFNCIVYPSQLDFDVRRVLESTKIPGSNYNDTNVLERILEPISWDFLTDTDAFFIGCKNRGIYELKGAEPVIRFFEDERNRTYCATVEWTCGFVVRNWRFWLGSNFATS